MNYQNKYLELLSNGLKDISTDYPNCDYFEKIIILTRKNNWNYGDIQKILGMPSKKIIRNVLLKWAPELIDNSVQKVNKYSTPYSEIYNILIHSDKTIWNIFGEDVECCIKDKKVYYDGDPLEYYTDVEHNQILNELRKSI